jgi:hypothetical protein
LGLIAVAVPPLHLADLAQHFQPARIFQRCECNGCARRATTSYEPCRPKPILIDLSPRKSPPSFTFTGSIWPRAVVMASLLDKILGLEYEHWDRALRIAQQPNWPMAMKNGVA